MSKKILTYGIPLLFFLLPWQTRWIFSQAMIADQPFEFGVMSLYVVQILLLIIFLFSGSRKIAKQNVVPARLSLALLIVPALSVLWALSPELALAQLMHVVFAMLLFLLLLDSRVDLRIVLWSFVAGLIVPSLLGIWQAVMGFSGASTMLGLSAHDALRMGESVSSLPDGIRMLRAHGSFQHPNVLGGYLAVGLVAIFTLLKRTKNELEGWVLVAVGYLLAFALAATFSQSAWLGLVLAIVVGAMVLLMKNTKLARLLVIPVAFVFIGGALGYVFAVGASASEVHAYNDLEARSSQERVEQYQDFTKVMQAPERWLIGFGTGNYLLALEQIRPGLYWWEYQPIHNVPLLILGEIGLVGLIVVLLWSSTIDKMNFARFPNREAVGAFMMGNIVLFVLFFDHYLWSQWAGLALIALVMACTVRFGEKPAKD